MLQELETMASNVNVLVAPPLQCSLSALITRGRCCGFMLHSGSRAGHQWVPSSGEKKLTGGSTWQAPMAAPGTAAYPAPMAQQAYPMVGG